MVARIAVVTGSNKGIGLAVVRHLAQQLDSAVVYLTVENTGTCRVNVFLVDNPADNYATQQPTRILKTRNPSLGQASFSELKSKMDGKDADKLRFHQLDITDLASCQALAGHLKKEYGGLDILVNNAGIAYKNASTAPFAEQALETLKINYFGTQQVSDVLFPLLRPGARVVNVCSTMGVTGDKYKPEIKQLLKSPTLTVAQLDELMKKFIDAASRGEHKAAGFPDSAYRVSKAGEIALTMLQHRQLASDPDRPGIVVNACCPGFVATDMTSHKGHLTVDQGADTPTFLATLPPTGTVPNGQFLAKRKVTECSRSQVTGSNKGIGLAVVQHLAQQLDSAVVYLTARNPSLGQASFSELKSKLDGKDADKLRFHQLDITDLASCQALAGHLKKEYGGLDILVNNAGIAYKNASTAPFGEQALETLKINYFGTKQISDVLFPLLKPGARVVNVCSRAGVTGDKYKPEIKQLLKSPTLTVAQLDELMKKFIDFASRGEHVEAGFPDSAYRVSKAGEIALTMIQHRQLASDPDRPGIVVNACCPGYVNTDMTSHKGHLTVDQGADTPTFLATLPQTGTVPNGQFLAERKVTEW